MSEPATGAETAPASTVRTFKRRRGRMSATKHDALRRLGPRWVIDVTQPGVVEDPPARPGYSVIDPATGWLDQRAAFGRAGAPLILDIGFGSGESTVALASARGDPDVLAVEVHTTGIAHLLRRIEQGGLSNIRLIEADVFEVLEHLAPGTLSGVQVFFPDPWPKRRHRGRRLVQPAFVGAVADRLVPGARLHLATDSDSYAAQMLSVVAADERFTVDDVRRRPPGDISSPPHGRALTTYERRGLDAGRSITDLSARTSGWNDAGAGDLSARR